MIYVSYCWWNLTKAVSEKRGRAVLIAMIRRLNVQAHNLLGRFCASHLCLRYKASDSAGGG